MKDETFHKLGILAWYSRNEIDECIDFVKVGNDFIAENSAHRKNMVGTYFTKDNFVPKQFQM
jgi:hypothetical protein